MAFVILECKAYLGPICVLGKKVQKVFIRKFVLFIFIEIHKEGSNDIVD